MVGHLFWANKWAQQINEIDEWATKIIFWVYLLLFILMTILYSVRHKNKIWCMLYLFLKRWENINCLLTWRGATLWRTSCHTWHSLFQECTGDFSPATWKRTYLRSSRYKGRVHGAREELNVDYQTRNNKYFLYEIVILL